MIASLAIERFKSIRSLTLACRKINILIGPPDTGKTNILESLFLVSCLGWNRAIGAALRLNPQIGC
jgi:AAA15 family ATPase/GTPase